MPGEGRILEHVITWQADLPEVKVAQHSPRFCFLVSFCYITNLIGFCGVVLELCSQLGSSRKMVYSEIIVKTQWTRQIQGRQRPAQLSLFQIKDRQELCHQSDKDSMHRRWPFPPSPSVIACSRSQSGSHGRDTKAIIYTACLSQGVQ